MMEQEKRQIYYFTNNQTEQSVEVPWTLFVNNNGQKKIFPGINLLDEHIQNVSNQYNDNCHETNFDTKKQKSVFTANTNSGEVPFVLPLLMESTKSGIRELPITNYNFGTQVYDNINTYSTRTTHGTAENQPQEGQDAYSLFKTDTNNEKPKPLSKYNQRMTGGDDCNNCPFIFQHDHTCFCPCPIRPYERLTKLFPVEVKDFRPTFGDGPTMYHFPNDCNRYKIQSKFPITLGTPIGLLTSTVSINDRTPFIQNERFASYLKAMAIIYLKDVRRWVSGDLDLIIREGQELATKTTLDPDAEPYKDVYSDIESKISRMFVFNGYRFKIELEPGDGNHFVKNELFNELNSFFKRKTYGLIQFKHWYLLIWKDRKKYFVLDLNGREVSTLLSSSASSTQKSVATLLCLKKLQNVVYLIVNMSNLDDTETFLIRPMVFAEIVTPEGGIVSTEFGVRQPEYKTINENYSYLLSNLHLTLNPAVPVRNRSAFPVSISAMIASKIDHPATWNSVMLDKVICYGVNVCRECWEPCVNLGVPINIDTFPRCMHMGQFLVSYELTSQKYVGKWKSRPVLLHNEFRNTIKTALRKHTNIIFQINNQMYGIWQKTGFYYLLDPYLHIIWGLKDDKNNQYSSFKSASLRMFRNVDTLVNVFHHILLQSNKTGDFYVHTLKIVSLVKCNNCSKVVEMPIEDDVQSLNEYICFNEDYSKCLDELGQYSDYEEDILSLVSLVSSVEASLSMVEEEEGEDVDAGGLSGFESTSSKRQGIKSEKSTESKLLAMGLDEGANKGGKGKGFDAALMGRQDDAENDGNVGKGSSDKGRIGKDGIGKDGIGKDGIGKDGIGKDGIGKDGIEKEGIGKDGIGKDGKDGPGKDVPGKVGSDKDGTEKYGIGRDDTGIDKDRKDGTGKDDTVKRGSGKDDNAYRNKDKDIIESDTNRSHVNMDLNITNLEKKRSKFGKGDKSGNDNDDSKDKSKIGKIDKSNKKTVTGIAGASKVPGKGRHREANEKGAPSAFVGQNNIDQEKDKMLNLYKQYGKPKLERYKKVEEPDPFLDSPCYTNVTKNLVIARSNKGTYESICKILYTALKCCDRVLIMTLSRHFVVFRGYDYMEDIFFVHDGCTCDLNRFRHMDLRCGTAGLLPFSSLHNVICYILNPDREAPRCADHENLDETRTCRSCFRNF